MTIPKDAIQNDSGNHDARPVPPVRDAHDAGHHQVLLHDPSDADARLDIALDESFPTSDAPGHSRPGTSEPAPSSGYDHEAETAILRQRRRRATFKSASKVGIPLIVAGALLGYVCFRLLATDNEVDGDSSSYGIGA